MAKKTILVTGANRGIGLEICRQLADLGHTVLLTSRDRAKGEEAADSLEGDVRFFLLDVSSDDSVARCVEEVSRQFDHLDVLINNAAIYKLPGTRAAPLRSATADEVMTIMNVNFFGPIRMNTAFLPLLRKSTEGRIINISSGMGGWDDLALGGHAGYRMSKVGLNAQTVQLASELRDTHIKVNAMCPGWVRTDMGGAGASRSVSKGAETAVWLATAEEIPSGKFWRDRREIGW